ncbi:unnamed protein product [Closterium sp. NIES-65]|nr:unnamed protein product [Closterium sp. NIES-65]
MKTDWEGRVAAINGAKSGELAAIAEDEMEGEKVIAMVDETFQVMGTFNLADFIPWLSPLDPQRIYARAKRLNPRFEGYVLACIAERKRMLETRRRAGERGVEERDKGERDVEPERGYKNGGEGGKGEGGDVKLGGEESVVERVLVDALLEIESQVEEEVTGKDRITREEIMLLCLDLINAGTDTTAKTVEWALAELASHPAMLEHLQAEKSSVTMAAGNSFPGTGWFASGINTAQHLFPNATASGGDFRAASGLVAAFIAAVAVLVSTSWLSFLRRRRSLPPGPYPWPILGNLPDLGTLPFRSLAKLADEYGPILTVWFGSSPSVVISSPELALEVLKTNDKLCSSRPMIRTLEIFSLGGKNIVFSQPNDRWRKLRRLATLHLLSAKKLQESLLVREEEVRDMLDAIAADAITNPSDVTKTVAATTGGTAKSAAVAEEGIIEVRRYLSRATLNNIMRITVGKRFGYSSIRGAASATPKALLDAAMRIDWNARIAAMSGEKCGGEIRRDAAADAAAAPATGSDASAAAEMECRTAKTNLSSPTEATEGEVAFAIIEEGFALAGAFNLADYVPWLSYWDPLRMYARALRLAPQLFGLMGACIAERRQLLLQKKCSTNEGNVTLEEETTLVDTLFEIEGEGEDQMNQDEMLMLAIDMMMAGTDTTAKNVEWALAELAQHPDMLEMLRAEVDEAYARSARAAAEAGVAAAGGSDRPVSLPVAEMPYLQAVIKETLRHYPVAPFLVPHQTTGSITIGDYHIPPNTMIQINGWALSHDPTVWINSHKFDPSRFLVPEAPDVTGQNFSLLPFGSGRRGCLGTNLGLDLSARLLANFVRRFDFKLPEDVRAAGGLDMA